ATDPEPVTARVQRVVALALLDDEEGAADVAVQADSDEAEVTLTSPDPYGLGRLVARLEVAAHAESLRAVMVSRGPAATTLRLESADRR
ncbi:MAG: hypothetical protein ACRCZP_14325, partial [Phycicoccus sp.]